MANLKPPSPQQGSALAKKALAQPSTASNGTSPTDKQQKLAQTLLDKLWLKMTEMYGTRWTASVGDCPDQDHAWSTVLGGLNGREIANGLNVLVERGLEWPPSAPEFRRMCLHIPGLPSAVEAWAQALSGNYTHETVKVAAELTGTFELRKARLCDRHLQQQFDRNFAIVCQRLRKGEPLGVEVLAGIGHDSQKSPAELSNEYNDQLLRQRIEQQGVPSDPAAARAAMLAALGIKRDSHASQ